MGNTPLDLTNKHRHYGPCAWEDCTHAGALTKGLCRRHYDALRNEAIGLGYIEPVHQDAVVPIDCECRFPVPTRVRIIGGRVIVPGAYQCARCGRRVDCS